jgi:glycosyltransferase involved in cell wall biosynthesis
MNKKVAVVATASASGEMGGAERFYEGLRNALRGHGLDAQIVPVIPDESNFHEILRSYLKFYDLDFTIFDGIISTKAPGYVVRHPNHVCYLQHTMRTFYDMFDVEYPMADAGLREQRKWVQHLDTAALLSPNIKRVFVIGEEVKDRLLKFNGVQSEVLYQATTLTGFRRGAFDYLFMPGRLHRWKRVNLVIEAMAHVKATIKLLISGIGEDEAGLKELAAANPRIVFLGRVSDEELLEYYSNALAVPFVPYREDFGLVAIEAFHSGKPLITCRDSGEPARMATSFEAGLICDPIPQAVAAAIDTLFEAPETARRLGENGRLKVSQMDWDTTATQLVAALGFQLYQTTTRPYAQQGVVLAR